MEVVCRLFTLKLKMQKINRSQHLGADVKQMLRWCSGILGAALEDATLSVCQAAELFMALAAAQQQQQQQQITRLNYCNKRIT